MLTGAVSTSIFLSACGDGSGSPSLVEEQSYPVIIRDTAEIRDSVVIEDDVAVVARDGTRLSARVFRPTGDGAYPVIMSFTSYGKDKGPDTYPPVLDSWDQPEFNLGTFEVSEWTTWEGPDPAYWVPRGYAVVYVDARGYHASAGDASVLGEQDRLDFHDAIEWAGTRQWSNGRVGLTGVSYLAISQWVAAGGNPPDYLKAIMPWEGQTDAFREVIYHGGIPETAFTSYWLQRVNSLANTPPLPALADFQVVQRNLQVLKAVQPPLATQPQLVEVPALICATWSDQGLHTRGSFEGYKNTGSAQKWLFTHGREKWSTYYGDEALQFQQRFFDYFLKGEANGMDAVRSVRLEVRESLEEYAVRYEDNWPIARTRYTKLYLDAAMGELSGDMPAQAASATYDPAYGSTTFTHVFDEDTELTGNMKLRLWVSVSEGDDMDIFVGVKKFDAQGDEVHFYAKTGYILGPVAMGWLRASERELDQERSRPWQPVLTHENPQPLVPGQVVPVEIEILPSSTLFRAGESLQLVIQGTDLFEHPSLEHGFSAETNMGTHAIHTGADYDAHLLVPVIP
ncbi:MAG: CocE/NonD family hydrolase [Halioglobus sp.]|nr:CocE/NonD family hydrolase [Halioglobus sp.]